MAVTVQETEGPTASKKFASYLSRLNPIPTLPEYTGPYGVGTVDVEIPTADLESPAPAPPEAADIETIQFRVFYPTLPGAEGQRITWLPAPQRDHLSAYIKFLGIGTFWAQAASFLPRHLHYTSIPATKNAPLLAPPADSVPGGRWPAAVFSHGLGGNRNAYSQIAGSLASHGVVVFCPEHRDGSAAVSYVRIPSAQDRYFVRNTRTPIPYRRIPHDPTDEVHELRNDQLRIRLWELGLLHEAMLALDDGGRADDDAKGAGGFANLNRSTPRNALRQFAGRLHVREPGSIIFMGHSFGAATVTQFLKSVFYADEPAVASMPDPLYAPAPGSAIRTQITPRNVTILLDMWCFPLLAKSTKALLDLPLPVYARAATGSDGDGVSGGPAPGGRALLAVESQDFYKWTEHLHAKARILSPDPAAAVVDESSFGRDAPPLLAKPNFFWVRGAAHLNQSDFGLLFPRLTQRIFGSQAPERALRLNLRALLQVLRANAVPVARTALADLVDGGASAASYDKLAEASSSEEEEGDDASEMEKKTMAIPAVVAVDGVFDDAAILAHCGSGEAEIEAWEWIDIVGMGRVAPTDDDDDAGADGGNAEGVPADAEEAVDKREPEMAGVIEPGVAAEGQDDAVAAAKMVGAAAA